MMKNKNFLWFTFITQIVVLLFVLQQFTGCGIFQTVNLDTPQKKYLAARSELNILLESYLSIQDKVSDENHKKVKNAFKDADIALDTWEKCLDIPAYDYQPNLKTWLDAKNVILEVIRNGQ